MAQIKAAYSDREMARGMRPDAYRFVRPDWRRFEKRGSGAWQFYDLCERKFNPDQPRVPAGNSDGGQWVGGGNAGDGAGRGESATAFRSILEKAKKIAAGGRTGYLRCLDLCSPLLERFQRPGSDRNQWDFHKCMSICVGK